MTFDTLKYAETLEEAGVDKKQAAAQAHALQDIVTEKVASKNQLDKVETGLTAKIEKVETSLTARIEKVETSLTAKIEKVETSLTTKIEKVETNLTTKIEKLDIKMQGEFSKIEAILKIVVGIGVAILVGIFAMLIKAMFFS